MTGQMREELFDAEVSRGLVVVAGLLTILVAQEERAGVEEPVVLQVAQNPFAPLGLRAVPVLGEEPEEGLGRGWWPRHGGAVPP